MKDASSYVESLGFLLEEQGGKLVASRPLREETVRQFKRSNNFYEIEVSIDNGRVCIIGSAGDIAIAASELIDIEMHDRRSVEKLLSSCPYSIDEISNELLVSRKTAMEETGRLEGIGMAYKIGDLYFHQAFCAKETAEKVPMFLIEKYKASRQAAEELAGTEIGQQLLDKAFFYKGLFLKSVFGRASYVHD